MNDQPAFPGELKATVAPGLTKLEYACIKLKVPKSGNEELNKLIRESKLNDFAVQAMYSIMSSPRLAQIVVGEEVQPEKYGQAVAIGSIRVAKELIKKLEAEK